MFVLHPILDCYLKHLVCYAEVHRAGSQETDFRLNFLERK